MGLTIDTVSWSRGSRQWLPMAPTECRSIDRHWDEEMHQDEYHWFQRSLEPLGRMQFLMNQCHCHSLKEFKLIISCFWNWKKIQVDYKLFLELVFVIKIKKRIFLNSMFNSILENVKSGKEWRNLLIKYKSNIRI